ncbi:hypothetical protein ES708_34347 [subsurface metagenome]
MNSINFKREDPLTPNVRIVNPEQPSVIQVLDNTNKGHLQSLSHLKKAENGSFIDFLKEFGWDLESCSEVDSGIRAR